MPQFARSLDVAQGFNFKKDVQTPIGYLLSLTLGGTALTADQETIKNPEEPDKNLSDKVVAVLRHHLWETGVTNPMYFSGQISTANKQQLASMLLGTWASIDVEFKYVIYEYDPLAKKYFKSAFVDAALKGILEKNGDDLNLSIADDPSEEVQSPKNYLFQIGIVPQTQEQSVNLATAASKNLSKQWGVTETAAK